VPVPPDPAAPPFSWWNPGSWLHHSAFTPGPDGAFIPATFRTGGSNSFSSIEAANGLPSGLLSSVSYVESRNNPNAVSPAGAMGQFQFTSNTARQYGLSNPFDPSAAASAAGRYLRDLLSRFHGNLEEAVAAYNAGPGTVQRDLAKYGADWRAYLPQETRRYIGSVLGGVGGMQQAHQFKDRSVTIKIENRTGGNATVSVSQLAV
jgi:soluble lytic murein transglycosylase-like protein